MEPEYIPNPRLTQIDVNNLEKRVARLEELFLGHIHYVNSILYITGTPVKSFKEEKK